VQQQHIPPHKKPRDYVLVVEWAESVRYRDVTTYPSKAARTQARVLIEKKLAEHKYFGGWKDRKKGYLYGPVFTEVMLTDQPIEERRKLTEQEAALKGLEALFAKEEK
jgi:hypothetical protein